MREIRLEYVHRGQTYLTASHSQLRYFLISRRDGENNGFLAGVPLLPPSSRAVSRPNSLPLPFRTPATQASNAAKEVGTASINTHQVPTPKVVSNMTLFILSRR